jgi:hypothetical protein
MNRTTLNAILAVLVLGLGAGAWYAKQQKDEPKAKLTPLAAEGVTRIRVEWLGSPVIALEKQGEDWQLTEPVKARADRFEATGATSLASTEVQEAVDGEGLNLKELGLEPPDHVVTLNDVKIEFGATEPLQSRRYVRVDGAVKLIDDPATAALDKDYADLVSKDLFASNDELVKIELPKGLVLTRDVNGAWSAPPGTANATPEAFKTLADGWKGARAMWNEAAEGPAPAGEAVRLTLKSGATRDYIVAATDPQLALYAPALQVRHQLSKALADALLVIPPPAPAPAEPAAAAPTAP